MTPSYINGIYIETFAYQIFPSSIKSIEFFQGKLGAINVRVIPFHVATYPTGKTKLDPVVWHQRDSVSTFDIPSIKNERVDCECPVSKPAIFELEILQAARAPLSLQPLRFHFAC